MITVKLQTTCRRMIPPYRLRSLTPYVVLCVNNK
jgi:hypothetical protein